MKVLGYRPGTKITNGFLSSGTPETRLFTFNLIVIQIKYCKFKVCYYWRGVL